jgi:hypothetical protein
MTILFLGGVNFGYATALATFKDHTVSQTINWFYSFCVPTMQGLVWPRLRNEKAGRKKHLAGQQKGWTGYFRLPFPMWYFPQTKPFEGA